MGLLSHFQVQNGRVRDRDNVYQVPPFSLVRPVPEGPWNCIVQQIASNISNEAPRWIRAR